MEKNDHESKKDTATIWGNKSINSNNIIFLEKYKKKNCQYHMIILFFITTPHWSFLSPKCHMCDQRKQVATTSFLWQSTIGGAT